MAGTNLWLHRFAVFVASCTLLLVFVGGLVTTTGSGLAVPDWPLSYGQFFPPMVGGVLYEHGHRLVAATVGLLTIILAVLLWRKEPRKWVRKLGLLALLAVICQGLLGGITVLLLLPTAVSVSHAGLAQIFFSLLVSIAVFTSRGWQQETPRLEATKTPSLKSLTVAATLSIYIQTLLGAVMRHTGSGLAIPDFPLAFGRLIPSEFTPQIMLNFAHRVGALVVTVLVVAVAVTVLRRHSKEAALSRLSLLLLLALVVQILLAAETVWSGRATIPTTLHVAGGAFILAVSLILTLRVHRVFLPRPEALQAAPAGAGAAME